MKRITLTCPFTGLQFDATQFADGTVVFIHPITGEEMRMTWNASCQRYMLPKSAFKLIDIVDANEACKLLNLSKQRVNVLCLEGVLNSRLISGMRYITKESIMLYNSFRKTGRPRKGVNNG